MTNVVLFYFFYIHGKIENKKICLKALNQVQHIVPINKQQQK